MKNLSIPLPLSRGISCDDFHPETVGKMVFGSPLITLIDGETVISLCGPNIDDDPIDVRSETLGMYIGREDMNGTNIFTGDVLKDEYLYSGEMRSEYSLVCFDKYACSATLHSSEGGIPLGCGNDFLSKCEVIGNIHENPELLKLFPHLQEV